VDPSNREKPSRPSRVLDAVFASDEEALRAAIDDGEDVDAWDDFGMTALLYAVFRGDIEAVGLLLRMGADPNRPQRDDFTATPLWHAKDDFGLHEIAALLEKAGGTNRVHR
jgi:ankyrin repeat protein